MKKSSVSASLHHLKLASEYYQDFIRDNRGSIGAKIFKVYDGKINWILNDMKSNPLFPDEIRDGLRKDLNSDLLVIPSIAEKIHFLTPELRELAEQMIDIMLSGESFEIEYRKDEVLPKVQETEITEAL